MRHLTVYQEPGMFCGLPANNGIWSWGDEIVVGFSKGVFKENKVKPPSMDCSLPQTTAVARSLDGGEPGPTRSLRTTGRLLPEKGRRPSRTTGHPGNSWQFLSKVADTDDPAHHFNGSPPSLVRLQDGRLCVTYGFRAAPFGIRARISPDEGRSWGDEVILRDDGRTFDVGYPRSVVRGDGQVVTTYYFATQTDYEQHVAATIWDPGDARAVHDSN